MPVTSTTIANSALTKLGERTIAGLSDTTVPAQTIAARIEECRKAVLRTHPWGFATTRATISVNTITNAADNGSGLIRITSASHGFITGNKVTVSGIIGTSEANGQWTVTLVDANNFDLQSSIFTNTYISGGVVGLRAEYNWAYRILLPSDFIRLLHVNCDSESWRLEGTYILTQDPSIEIQYIYDVTDYDIPDALFNEALACYLAWDTCYRITKNLNLKNQLLQDYEGVVKRARFVNATEERPDGIEATDWLDQRLSSPRGFVRDPMT